MKKLLSIVAIVAALAVGGALAKAAFKALFKRSDPISFDDALGEMSKRINANLPMMIDGETRLDTTFAGPGNRVTYLYTLVNVSSAELEPGEFVDAMRPRLINNYRDL